MATTRTEIVKAEGFTLPQIIWRLLGRQPRGYFEQVLEANPELAKLGPELPVGTAIVFPLSDIPAETTAPEVVRLWD